MKRRHALVLLTGLALLVVGVAHAQNALTVWGTVAQDFAGRRLPFGVPQDLRITLETTTSSAYRQTIDSNRRDPRANWFSTGEFQFRQVPTDVPLRLTVEYRFPNRTDTYVSTYRFRYPTLADRALTGLRSAERIAGYMGDFVLVVQTERIIREERPASRLR
jgi:predicted porin